MAIYNPENILQYLGLSSIKFFTFKKDDLKNKKTEVPNRLLEVKGTSTRKCHKVLVDPESVKIIMKDTSNQIGKACQFCIRKKIKKENNDAEKDKDKSNEDKSKDENGDDEKVEELDVELVSTKMMMKIVMRKRKVITQKLRRGIKMLKVWNHSS